MPTSKRISKIPGLREGVGSLEPRPKKVAVGPQGSGGTLKRNYSAGEILKALVSNEG